uniref:Mediator of RNA polymerase II transcription subunit 7 n=1 Tax=Meloidogyne hapla TaxID=6305 RepID=A0A1I8BHH9_MELHA
MMESYSTDEQDVTVTSFQNPVSPEISFSLIELSILINILSNIRQGDITQTPELHTVLLNRANQYESSLNKDQPVVNQLNETYAKLAKVIDYYNNLIYGLLNQSEENYNNSEIQIKRQIIMERLIELSQIMLQDDFRNFIFNLIPGLNKNNIKKKENILKNSKNIIDNIEK